MHPWQESRRVDHVGATSQQEAVMSTVPTTAQGIVCGKCSTFTNKVRHASVAAVRLCNTETTVQAAPSSPYRVRCDASTTTVEAGRYAVRYDGGVRFYRVDRPTEGRWAGRVFVKVQAGDELHPVKSAGERSRILELIGQDPKAAMLLYGQEIGSCGHCGRTLTNDESRAVGIGPVCRGKMGW